WPSSAPLLVAPKAPVPAARVPFQVVVAVRAAMLMSLRSRRGPQTWYLSTINPVTKYRDGSTKNAAAGCRNHSAEGRPRHPRRRGPVGARSARGVEPVPQRVEFAAQGGRELVAEDRVELLGRVGFCEPGVHVHVEELVQVGIRDVQALEVEVFATRQPADRAVHGADLARDATDDPVDDARVVAEAGPQEAAVLAATEPVHLEDARSTIETQLAAHLQPVTEVVAHVVAAEREH